MRALVSRGRIAVAIVFVFSTLSISVIAIAHSRRQAELAEDMMDAVAKTRVGSNQADWNLFASRFIAALKNIHQDKFGRTVEVYGFANRERWSSSAFPRKSVIFVLYFESGVLVQKEFFYEEDRGIRAYLREEVKRDTVDPLSSLRKDGRLLSIDNGRPSGNYAHQVIDHADVYDDTSTPSTVRDSDWKVDVGCLSKLGRCRDVREVLVGGLSSLETR